MEFEVLKKSHKKEIIIGISIFIVIGIVLVVKATFAKYELVKNIKIAEGTINYKLPDFKIMAMYKQKENMSCTEDSCYSEITETNRMPSSGYIINETKSYCSLDNINKDIEAKLYTNNSGEHIISNLAKSSKCYLYFDKEKNASDKIIEKENPKTTTPNFSVAATSNEGMYKVSDGIYGGYSYYYRGAVTKNHVIFANKCWRIVRINGNGTIRLIYNGVPTNNVCVGNGVSNSNSNIASDQAYVTNTYGIDYAGWTYLVGSQRPTNNNTATASNIKTQTENWYNTNIGNYTNYADKVANGKFCNDRNMASSSTWSSNPKTALYYAGYERASNSAPTLSCPSGDIYTLKIGAITMDEVLMAGGKAANSSYYLYNGFNFWTMTPNYIFYDNGGNKYMSAVFNVKSDGSIYYSMAYAKLNIRPVINLIPDVKLTGAGTLDNPYIVE